MATRNNDLKENSSINQYMQIQMNNDDYVPIRNKTLKQEFEDSSILGSSFSREVPRQRQVSAVVTGLDTDEPDNSKSE